MLISDISNSRIRAIDLESGIIRTIAGNGKRGKPADNRLAIEQATYWPEGSNYG